MTLTFPGSTSTSSSTSSSSCIHVVELASSDVPRRDSNRGSNSSSNQSSADDNTEAAVAVHRSLQTVGRVLCALAKGAEACAQLHVPFEDTALTALLRASLCHSQGTCALLATVKPNEENYDETLATLRSVKRRNRKGFDMFLKRILIGIENSEMFDMSPMRRCLT